MIREEKKLIVHKVIWSGLLLWGILIPILVFCLPQKIEEISHNGSLVSYYEYSNESVCEIEITFNKKIESGNITVAFYDANGQFLSEEDGYLLGYGSTTASCTFYFVPGKVDKYLILDWEVNIYRPFATTWLIVFIYLDVFLFVFWVATLTLSCKIYDYNDTEIIVYAGWFHHYIKVDGTILDEHNALFWRVAIELSCVLDDGTDLKARITTGNRISLKVNNRLYTTMKK